MSKQAIFDKFIDFMGRFSEFEIVTALRDGFIYTMPFTISGSLFLLIANLPIPGYAEFMASIFGENWSAPLQQVAGATFEILSIIIVLGMTYKFCANRGCDAISAAGLALCSFLIVIKSSVISDGGEIVSGVIPKGWVGSNGVITAILVSIVVSKVFCYCEKNKITIKMPSQVPSGVARAFAALIPAVIIFTGSAIIYALCDVLTNVTFPELVFTIIQIPLQSLSDTLGGAIVVASLQSILFWAGIHGPNIIGGVINPVLMANAIDNQQLVNAGMSLIGNPQAKIFTIQISDVFIQSGGTGMTLGLLIASYIKAKSSQLKSLTKLAIVPGLFNINEPVIFGLPIVFNPYLLVPFVVVPVITVTITYCSILFGFMAPCSAVMVPWTTPPILSGLLLNGWQGAVVQIINLIVAIVIYMPFIILQDKANLKEEQQYK